MLNNAYGISTKQVTNLDPEGIVAYEQLRVDPFLGGEAAWRCAVKSGSSDRDALESFDKNARSVSESRFASNGQCRRDGIHRSPKNQFGESEEAANERCVAKH